MAPVVKRVTKTQSDKTDSGAEQEDSAALLRDKALAQARHYQEEALMSLGRLGRGLAAWQAAQDAGEPWEWEPPGEGATIDEFPPLARLLALWNKAYCSMDRAGARLHMERPDYCPECAGHDNQLGTHFAAYCVEHVDWAIAAATWASHLGFVDSCPGVTDRRSRKGSVAAAEQEAKA